MAYGSRVHDSGAEAAGSRQGKHEAEIILGMVGSFKLSKPTYRNISQQGYTSETFQIAPSAGNQVFRCLRWQGTSAQTTTVKLRSTKKQRVIQRKVGEVHNAKATTTW